MPAFKGREPDAQAPIPPHPKYGREQEVYAYRDAEGRPLFYVCRYDLGEGKKTFLQGRHAGEGWVWSLDGVERVLYRFPELAAHLEAGSPDPIYIPEGEKDVHALLEYLAEHDLPGTATCNPMGAGKWRPGYTEALHGARHVVVVADNDDNGLTHARKVAAELSPHVDHLELVRPAVHEPKADLSDHLAAGRSLEDLVPLEPEAGEMEPGEAPLAARVVSLEEFAATEEEGEEALLGDKDNALVPESGDGMFYGDGGAGKTTLVIDLCCHLAAGDDWLGIRVPQPLRVLIIENEGPRARFRRKLRRKRDAWAGSPLSGRISVLEAPWAAFTFAAESWRAFLAQYAAEHEIDVVIVGPVASAGMEAAGTIQDVRAFLALVDEVRVRSGRRLASLLVRHENKGGKVSGAWEGAGDTLVHVQGQGHGRLRLHWQKARWASDYHGTTMQLAWAEGESFEVENKEELDAEAMAELLLAYIGEHPGTGWGKVEKAAPGMNRQRRMEVRDGLLAAGQIVNVRRKRDEPEVVLDHLEEATPAHLYLASDPTIAQLLPGPGAVGEQPAPAGGERGDKHLLPAPRPEGEQGEQEQPSSPRQTLFNEAGETGGEEER